MKKLQTKLEETGKSEEEIAEFKKSAMAAAKKILAGIKDYDFYTGESMDIDGMVVLLNYREDGVTPYMTFWKHGLKEEKV